MAAIHSLSLFRPLYTRKQGFPGGSEGKASACDAGDMFDPWVGKIPWRRKWQSTPVFLPGESHGERSLVGYSPQGLKELDTTERLHYTTHVNSSEEAQSFCLCVISVDNQWLRN